MIQQTSTTSSSVNGQKKRPRSLILTTEQENDVVEWLMDHPCLFDKKEGDYKDTAMKARLWNGKAEELQMDVSMLRTWFESMRTRFGKLTKRKSGDGAPQKTDRDKWILSRFAFLASHIVRHPGRPAGGLKRKLAAVASTAVQPPLDRSEDEEEEEVGSQSSPQSRSATPVLPSTSDVPANEPRLSRRRSSHRVTLTSLEKRSEESKRLHERIEEMLASADQTPPSDRRAWSYWQAAMMEKIDDSLMMEYFRQCFDLTASYIERTEQLRQQRHHLAPDVQPPPSTASATPMFTPPQFQQIPHQQFPTHLVPLPLPTLQQPSLPHQHQFQQFAPAPQQQMVQQLPRLPVVQIRPVLPSTSSAEVYGMSSTVATAAPVSSAPQQKPLDAPGSVGSLSDLFSPSDLLPKD